MRDDLASMSPRKNECAVVNLDSSRGEGTHWVAYSKRGDRSLYYDSFGDLPPPREIARYLDGSSIEYNYRGDQTYGSVVCGHLCLSFLIKAAHHWESSSIWPTFSY